MSAKEVSIEWQNHTISSTYAEVERKNMRKSCISQLLNLDRWKTVNRGAAVGFGLRKVYIDQRCKLIETLEIAQNCNKKTGSPCVPLILSVFS